MAFDCLIMCKGCFSIPLFLFLVLPSGSFGDANNHNNTEDLNKFSYSLIQPTIYLGRTRREISTTTKDVGGHHSSVTLTVPMDGEELILDLELNEDLVPEDHTLQYQEGDKIVNHKPNKEELCHYHGSVRGKSNSWAAVSTCHGVSGVIFDGTKMRHIEPAEGPGIRSKHFLYERDDLDSISHLEGGSEETQFSPEQLTSRALETNRYKRHTSFQEPYSANGNTRYVELVLVADYGVYKLNNGNIRSIHRKFIQAANIVNSAYNPVNIHIVLVGVVVWNRGNEITISKTEIKTLTNFGNYRKDKLIHRIPHDSAHLITKHSGGGLSFVGGMCTPKWSVASVLYNADALLLAGRMAHEMGHSLGMDHDANFRKKGIRCDCPDRNCIQSGIGKMRFSTCSLKSLSKWLKSGWGKCLRNKPQRLFSPSCGDGFVEPGEECDCGVVPPTGKITWCRELCDMNTCKFKKARKQRRRRLRDVSSADAARRVAGGEMLSQ